LSGGGEKVGHPPPTVALKNLGKWGDEGVPREGCTRLDMAVYNTQHASPKFICEEGARHDDASAG
jgi:hypothetical protein